MLLSCSEIRLIEAEQRVARVQGASLWSLVLLILFDPSLGKSYELGLS